MAVRIRQVDVLEPAIIEEQVPGFAGDVYLLNITGRGIKRAPP